MKKSLLGGWKSTNSKYTDKKKQRNKVYAYKSQKFITSIIVLILSLRAEKRRFIWKISQFKFSKEPQLDVMRIIATKVPKDKTRWHREPVKCFQYQLKLIFFAQLMISIRFLQDERFLITYTGENQTHETIKKNIISLKLLMIQRMRFP